MTDRPILFSAPMVRALLGGRKTQTRRVHFTQSPVMTPKCDNGCEPRLTRMCISPSCNKRTVTETKVHVGDRLYVREHWRTTLAFEDLKPSQMKSSDTRIKYEADGLVDNKLKSFDHFHEGRFRQGMHMPRWASRLTLIVTDVRVERLQAISEADAVAEGCFKGKASGRVFANEAAMHLGGDEWANARDWYADLWEVINGPGAWQANPWVAAYTFTVIPKNIDEA